METANNKETYNDQQPTIKETEIDITAGAKNTSSIPKPSAQTQTDHNQRNLESENESSDEDLTNPAIRGI